MILVIDDSEDFLEIFEMVALELNQKVLLARGSEEALRLLESCEIWPEVLFLDYFMPDGNGDEFVKTLKKSFPEKSKDLRIILLTNLNPGAPQLQDVAPLVSGIEAKPSELLALKHLILNAASYTR